MCALSSRYPIYPRTCILHYLSNFYVRQRAQLSVSSFQTSSPFRASFLYVLWRYYNGGLETVSIEFRNQLAQRRDSRRSLKQPHSSPPALTSFLSSREIICVQHRQHRAPTGVNGGIDRLHVDQKAATGDFQITEKKKKCRPFHHPVDALLNQGYLCGDSLLPNHISSEMSPR